MESLPTAIFSVNINCCKSCPKKLKKSLLNIQGVFSVTVDAEKRLVSVVGKADPTKLLDAISKMGKKPELLSYGKEPCKDNKFSHGTANKTMDRESYVKGKYRQSGIRNRIFSRDDAESDHKVEGYIPDQVDERCCRDPFCRAHRRFPSAYAYSSLEDYGNGQQMGCNIM